MIWLTRELPHGGTLHFARLPGRLVHDTAEVFPDRQAVVIRPVHFVIPPVQRTVARGEDVSAMLAAMTRSCPADVEGRASGVFSASRQEIMLAAHAWRADEIACGAAIATRTKTSRGAQGSAP